MAEKKWKQKERQTTAETKKTDYEDPICVCEAEPRWEELGRELGRKERESS